MQVGFFCAFRNDPEPYVMAGLMLAAIRKHMPGVEVVQFTDGTSPLVFGVDSVRRGHDGPLLEQRLQHYAQCTGEWLLIDTDVEVRADVQDVFVNNPFDIAVTDRNWPGIPNGERMLLDMPFNAGVCFSRKPSFWQRALDIWRTYPQFERNWLSDQRALYEVVRSGAFLVQILRGSVYNCPPVHVNDPCAGAKVVHWKGPRKIWWVKRAEAQAKVCQNTAAQSLA